MQSRAADEVRSVYKIAHSETAVAMLSIRNRVGGIDRILGPNGGIADSLDEAKAAFRRAWERAGQTKGG